MKSKALCAMAASTSCQGSASNRRLLRAVAIDAKGKRASFSYSACMAVDNGGGAIHTRLSWPADEWETMQFGKIVLQLPLGCVRRPLRQSLRSFDNASPGPNQDQGRETGSLQASPAIVPARLLVMARGRSEPVNGVD